MYDNLADLLLLRIREKVIAIYFECFERRLLSQLDEQWAHAVISSLQTISSPKLTIDVGASQYSGKRET